MKSLTCICLLSLLSGYSSDLLQYREINQDSSHYEAYLNYFDEVSLEEARRLILEAYEEASLLPHMEVELYISFRKPNGELIEAHKLSSCSLSQGTISYFSRLYGKKRVLYQETLEEAQTKLLLNH